MLVLLYQILVSEAYFGHLVNVLVKTIDTDLKLI